MEKVLVIMTRPPSLLDLCTEMVATHLDQVETFVGLPSLIGEKIFNAGCSRERFKFDVEYSTQAVRLFTDAYKEEFLSSLSFSGEHLGLNYCLEQILLFRDLVKLDLSYCGLGDDHEMLTQFQNLNRLEVFSLCGNVVTNTGIQKMTAAYRMFKRGPTCLQMLDLRDNTQISKICLKYLTKFEFLETVMFSELLTQKSKTFGCWTLEDGKLDVCIETVGWAKVLIGRWMLEARQKSEKSKPKPKTGAFPIRKCLQASVTDVLSSSCNAGNHQKCDVIARRLNGSRSKACDKSQEDEIHKKNFSSRLDLPKSNIDLDREKLVDLYGNVNYLINEEKLSLKMFDVHDGDLICLEKSSRHDTKQSRNGEKENSELIPLSTSKDCLSRTRKANPFKMNYQTDVDGQKLKSCERNKQIHVHSKVVNKTDKGQNSQILVKSQKRDDKRVNGGYLKIKENIETNDQTYTKISKFFTCTHSTQPVQSTEIQPQNDDQSSEHQQCETMDNQSDFITTSNDLHEHQKHKDTDFDVEKDPILKQNISPGVVKSKKRKRIVIKKNPGLNNLLSSETDKSGVCNKKNENHDCTNDYVDNDLTFEPLQKTKKFKSSLMQSLDMYL